MKRYGTRGTPWVVIIARKGIVRYSDFHIKKQEAVQLIDGLLQKKTARSDGSPVRREEDRAEARRPAAPRRWSARRSGNRKKRGAEREFRMSRNRGPSSNRPRRRDFLRWLGGLSMAALAGCRGGTEQERPAATRPKRASAAPASHEPKPTPSEGVWPAWRGPSATGVAPQATPPVEWDEAKNVRWKIDLPGEGHSTPVAWGDRLYPVRTPRRARPSTRRGCRGSGTSTPRPSAPTSGSTSRAGTGRRRSSATGGSRSSLRGTASGTGSALRPSPSGRSCFSGASAGSTASWMGRDRRSGDGASREEIETEARVTRCRRRGPRPSRPWPWQGTRGRGSPGRAATRVSSSRRGRDPEGVGRDTRSWCQGGTPRRSKA